MTETTKKVWTIDAIKALLDKNDDAVDRAIVQLYHRQTQDEKSSESTRNLNNRGFTQADARIMSSMAKWVLRGNKLSYKQLHFLRSGKSTRYPSRIGKYARQLLEIAQQNQAAAS